MNGDHARAAQLLASLAGSQPDQVDLAKKALGEAIGAGRMDLALSLARSIPSSKLPTDARLLLVTDEVKHRRADRALPWLAVSADNGDLGFLAPLITAWDAADRGNVDLALKRSTKFRSEACWGRSGRGAGADFAQSAANRRGRAVRPPRDRRRGGREDRLRLAFADGFLAAGDRARALMMLEGIGGDSPQPGSASPPASRADRRSILPPRP